jgi:hypothetical protein
VKRTGRGKSVGAIIHICMEITQGYSLCNYLCLKLAKHRVSRFIFYVFSSAKLENRIVEQVLPGGVLAPVGGEYGRERGERMNVVQTMYTHVCKCKNDTC